MQLPDVRDPGDGTRHGGQLALDAARRHGVERMFTLSGAHVFPLYDAAVTSHPPLPIVDVRHEQTAVFAAEATAKLTRRPGLAVLTAGPGVTNGVSALAQARASGVPLLVLGGRAPRRGWGRGALQELDHPAVVTPVTTHAVTAERVTDVDAAVDAALTAARTPHRGPAFVDVPVDELFARAQPDTTARGGPAASPRGDDPDPDDVRSVAEALARATRPVLVLGGDVWLDGAEDAALRLVEALDLPTVTNGLGRGVLPRGHRLLVSRARSAALRDADLVVVTGTPLDFRLGYGHFGAEGGPATPVVHLADSRGQLARHLPLAASAAGDLTTLLDAVQSACERQPQHADRGTWAADLAAATSAAAARDAELLRAAPGSPVHPARIVGELLPLLDDDAVLVGDGGDVVSFAGRLVEPSRPGCWLDPGPYGCLGAGLGAALAARLARPSSQVVALLGDGAAGFSLLDADTLVRHGLPVVLVVSTNGAWGLEKHPMRALYGYDVAADLSPRTRYDDVVRALGGAGETVADAADLGPALRRALGSGVPYLVNVLTDPEVAYPRRTTGL